MSWQTGLRLIFGASLLLHAANHFLGFVPEPQGTHPLAIQLMSAFEHSRLLDVVMAFQAAAGLLILAGIAVPFALAVAMPISVCGAYWAVVLEHDPLWAALALAALGSNALLMFVELPAYRGVLQRRALAVGEGPDLGDNYDGLYMHIGPRERVPTGKFAAAAVVLVAALAFYWYLVPNVTGSFARYVIIVPAVLLLLRGTQIGKAAPRAP